jgi:thymidine kinase
MPKLYFRYGAMNSSKTANLLMVAHNYESQDKKVILIKPKIDNRFGDNIIKSRSGIEKKANLVIEQDFDLYENFFIKLNNNLPNIILVDEANFLTSKQVDQLRIISMKIPVIAYGLRTDYKTNLFEGSKRLMEIADSIEEIKTICNYCDTKAIINMKHNNGKSVKDGSDVIDLGCENKYLAVCWKCWVNSN